MSTETTMPVDVSSPDIEWVMVPANPIKPDHITQRYWDRAMYGFRSVIRECVNPQPHAAPKGWDAEFLAKRLARVAKLAGVEIPDGLTYEQVAEVAPAILGQIASFMEQAPKVTEQEPVAWKDAPEKIFLVIEEDDGGRITSYREYSREVEGEICWCENSQGPMDIAYIRADLSPSRHELLEAQALREEVHLLKQEKADLTLYRLLLAAQLDNKRLHGALKLWEIATQNAEECEFDDMASYVIPMPLFCEAEEATREALSTPIDTTELDKLVKDAEQTQAASDVLAERKRQKEEEGWTPEHDDKHTRHEMALAAAAYASSVPAVSKGYNLVSSGYWPWDSGWFKPGNDPRQTLVKAGALILAEIERVDRIQPSIKKAGMGDGI